MLVHYYYIPFDFKG